MDFFQHLKRYVWDDTKTPYLVSPNKLNKTQADKEVFIYALFLTILFGMVTIVLFAEARLELNYHSIWKATFALTLMSSAIMLGITKKPVAALYCMSAPVAAFLYIIDGGLNPDLESLQKYLLLAFTAAWLWYAWRVVAVARAYPHPARPGDLS